MPDVLVLIVDDNEKNVKLARDVLRFAGCRTLEAGTGAEGVALAAEHLPDVILMDIRLPDMDGGAALRQLRARPARPGSRSIAAHVARDEGRPRAVPRRRLRRLPREADQRSRAPGAGTRLLRAGRGGLRMEGAPKILVVDDLPRNIRLLEAVLVPRGYVVVPAASGEEALEKLSEQPDLILLDVQMPGIDGYEVCRRIRASTATAFLPVVMITSSDSEARVNGLEAGADDFVTKPFDQQELLARVRSLVRIKEYHDTVERQAAELVEWNRTLEARVEEQTVELRASRTRVVSAADAERRRIERDLHDGAQQHLIGLAVHLRLARDLTESNPEQAGKMLDGLGDDVQEALEHLRDLAHGIYPPLLAGPRSCRRHRGGRRPGRHPDHGQGGRDRAVRPRCRVHGLFLLPGGAPERVEVRRGRRGGHGLRVRRGERRRIRGPGRRRRLRLREERRRRRSHEHARPCGALGGTLAVESTPGRGTTVSGLVPAER